MSTENTENKEFYEGSAEIGKPVPNCASCGQPFDLIEDESVDRIYTTYKVIDGRIGITNDSSDNDEYEIYCGKCHKAPGDEAIAWFIEEQSKL